VRLDNVTDSERVDVGVESACESTGYTLSDQLRDGVGVHGVDVLGLVEREGSVFLFALAEAYFVGGFAAGDDDFADAELAGGFDYIVC
jgi:hypothetical protein